MDKFVGNLCEIDIRENIKYFAAPSQVKGAKFRSMSENIWRTVQQDRGGKIFGIIIKTNSKYFEVLLDNGNILTMTKIKKDEIPYGITLIRGSNDQKTKIP